MAEYYVVRDKNTGLYFRGKGVNRWGKYYNQASIYRVKANAENMIKEVSWRGEQAEIVPIQIVETTADVVPKSEVDWHREAELNAQRIIELEAELANAKSEVDGLQKELTDMLVSKQTILHIPMEYVVRVRTEHPIYKAIKAEVAREIFEEIEDVLNNIGYFGEIDFEALKKKYTEGEGGE